MSYDMYVRTHHQLISTVKKLEVGTKGVVLLPCRHPLSIAGWQALGKFSTAEQPKIFCPVCREAVKEATSKKWKREDFIF